MAAPVAPAAFTIPADLTAAILEAIRTIKNPKGSNARVINLTIAKKHPDKYPKELIKVAMRMHVESGLLTINAAGQLYKVAGDPEYEDLSPKITMEQVASGQGAPAGKGDTVEIEYIARCLQADGRMGVFDRDKSFTFVLGSGDVIKGMDMGVTGMTVNSVRNVSIPPQLGYGKRGLGADVPPSATLHFYIALRGVNGGV